MVRLPGIYPSVALLVISDGRGLRDAAMESWFDNARHYELVSTIEVDDSHHVMGFCGAVRYAWERVRKDPRQFEYVFHLEEDWRFDREFSIESMARVLEVEPMIAQVALRRGAEPGEGWGVLAEFPDEFTDRGEWLEHELFFTTNPCLYRRSLADYEWPRGPGCEGVFGQMLSEMRWSFAYWGDRYDVPWITHTGQRTGHGY